MQKTLTILTLIVAAIAASFFLLMPDSPPSTGKVVMPWDIELHEDGSSEVFGIRLEQTTVREAIQTLGPDHELAVISDTSDHSGLELYYSHFKSGPLQAKLILAVQAPEDELISLRGNASHSEYLDSGSRKFLLSPTDLQRVQDWPIDSMALVPSANLSKDTIHDRFGEPEQTVETDHGVTHFLYNKLGLDVAYSEDSKELMQYVAPRSFARIVEPLQ